MKKISISIILLAMLLLSSACTVLQDTSSCNAPLVKQTSVSNEPITTIEGERETDNEFEDPHFLMSEPYSFSEVNPIFGANSLSVNELSKIFGMPSSVEGYYYDRNIQNGYYVISVMFHDVKFDLAANPGEEIGLTPIKNNRFEVPESSMDISLRPQYVSIWSGDWILPRGIKIGDSIETLYDVYSGNTGEERYAQGEFLVSYDYGESGSITYHFDATSSEGIVGGLKLMTIEWYHDSIPKQSEQSIQAPPP